MRSILLTPNFSWVALLTQCLPCAQSCQVRSVGNILCEQGTIREEFNFLIADPVIGYQN